MDENIKLFNDFGHHLLCDDIPSLYFNSILNSNPKMQLYPFSMLFDLLNTPQSPLHHPEGNVWNHTMLVIDLAAKNKFKSKDPRTFMWAALLHDLGKAATTKLRKNRITSYDHDKAGEILTVKFLSSFTKDEAFIKRVSSLVRWHMQILFVLKDLPFSDIESMLNEVPLEEISLLSLCDRAGRGDMTEEKFEEEKRDVETFVYKCKTVLDKNCNL